MSETPRIPDADRRRLIESIEQHGAATRWSAVAVAVEPLAFDKGSDSCVSARGTADPTDAKNHTTLTPDPSEAEQ